jgi:xanthine dehydrogenase accessory factor
MNKELHGEADRLFQKYFFTDRYSENGESEKKSDLIIVRGGGDLATGTIHRLWSAGFPVLVLETEYPAAIRRQVSLCEAVYEGTSLIEGMKGVRIDSADEAKAVIEEGNVPVLVDPEGKSIEALHPSIVIDAILAKKNLGTTRQMAGLTIGLGPGFTAGEDVDLVIETKRGHDLGRIIYKGTAVPNSGIPGNIGGYSKERVLHAEAEGILRNIRKIGDLVEAGEPIARIETKEGEIPVPASITGIIRGLIRDGYPVTKGFKIADIDPRKEELKNCFTISDKARCIAGSVLEAVCAYERGAGSK